MAGIRKPIQCYVTASDRQLAAHEAARRKITLQQLLTEWIEPQLQELRTKMNSTKPGPGRE